MTDRILKTTLALLIGATLLFVGCKDSHGSDDDGDITDMDEYEIDIVDELCLCEGESDFDYDYDYDTVPDLDLLCTPNATEPCQYTGPQGTENVGTCHAGTHTCISNGTAWGACIGEVKPVYDLCDNGLDEDCNGTVDDGTDMDGDGFTYCDEPPDCCEDFSQCPDPAAVHPGAPEIPNNCIDDNCNDEIDEVTDSDELLATDSDEHCYFPEPEPRKKR